MKSEKNKKLLLRSIGILAIGAVLTGGGLFLWQNNFDLSFFSQASTNTTQAILVLGEKDADETPLFATDLKKTLDVKQSKPVELIDRAENKAVTSTLHDQTVLGYNDVTKPITNRIDFLVMTGKNAFVAGIKRQDSPSVVSLKISQDISELVALTTARPGVLPAGFTIYLATIPDPLDGTGDVSLCRGVLPNYGKEYTNSVIEDINATIRSTATIYAQNIKIVDLQKKFVGHGLSGSNTWFSNCFTLNSTGEKAVSEAFATAVQNVAK